MATTSAISSSTGRKFDGIYFAGDGARRDEDGYFWIMGRIDDVINVAGHRLGTLKSKARWFRTSRRGSRGRRAARRSERLGDRRVRDARRRPHSL